MSLLDSLGIGACVLMVFAEVVWIGLVFERYARRLP